MRRMHCALAGCAAILILAVAKLTSAQTSGVDWKFYGGAKVDEQSFCFYESKGVEFRPDDHLRVWTKCLLQKDINSIDLEKAFNGEILENTARKVAENYDPPIEAIEQLEKKQIISVILFEEIANISDLKPSSLIFYEFSCRDRRLQHLSILGNVGGKSGFINTPGDWIYVPPEGAAANLFKIVCTSS